MLTICGRDLPAEKIPVHQARCSKCGGTPPHPPGTQHPVDYFTPDEALALILATTDDIWYYFFYVLSETGARIGEGLALMKKDIRVEDCELGIWTEKTKPKVYRRIPVTQLLMGELIQYSHKVRGRRLFPVSYESAVYQLRKTALRAGIDRRVCSHMFRHGMVRRIITSMPGATPTEALSFAAKIAGHKSIRTTMIYAESTEREAKDAYRKMLEGK